MHKSDKKIFVGIDVGGTFTDLVLYDLKHYEFCAFKVPSMPKSPEKAVLAALNKARVSPNNLYLVLHGTTVATNALLERKGAKIALLIGRYGVTFIIVEIYLFTHSLTISSISIFCSLDCLIR